MSGKRWSLHRARVRRHVNDNQLIESATVEQVEQSDVYDHILCRRNYLEENSYSYTYWIENNG